MKKKKTEQIVESEPPQQALERILKTEVHIAQKISAAKEHAEKAISAAREEVISVKEKIIYDARAQRDAMIAEGIEAANEKAKNEIEGAKHDSSLFFAAGEKFIDQAVADVIRIVLDDKDGSE